MSFPYPKNVLMVRPNGFRVDYAINPYMLDSSGRLQSVNENLAHVQWRTLKLTFESLGLRVAVIEGDTNYPDMVFCANQALPYWAGDQRTALILSRMHSAQRKGEVAHFKRWAEEQNIPAVAVTDFDFEGAGDAIWNYEKRELICGYGFRTDAKVYDFIAPLVARPLHTLRLVSEHFYHLDTCLAVLRGDCAAYVPEAFDSSSLEKLKSLFPRLIPIALDEARQNFAGNCVSVDGKHVILQSGSSHFVTQLKAGGFTPVEIETTEFMKSGGSVFCMKQLLP